MKSETFYVVEELAPLSKMDMEAAKLYAETGCVTKEYLEYVLGDQTKGISLS